MSTYVITGYKPSDIGPLSDYFARNVSESSVERLVALAEERGWINVVASVESF